MNIQSCFIIQMQSSHPWLVCGACGERRVAYRILMGNLKERDGWENFGIDERLIFKGICKK